MEEEESRTEVEEIRRRQEGSRKKNKRRRWRRWRWREKRTIGGEGDSRSDQKGRKGEEE